MSAETMPSLIVASPSAYEVAIIKLPVGTTARVCHPNGPVREYVPPLDVPYFVVVPGCRETIDWGCTEGWHESLKGIRNGHLAMHREAWHAAARLLARADVVYVRYEQRDYYGKPRWTAVRAEVREVVRPVQAVSA
ncbi:hypothetical protein ACQP2T_63730 (plasmid) [Nonomuraea sp. CA-143628]|uniref:hypothetical protein n=1 Tax=Nonomuraea sp. CA-143628 TaxID=3239997 RepID=UPI003D90A931